MSNQVIQWVVALSLVVAALYANYRFRIDLDVGGYSPRLSHQAAYPKAFVHFVGGFALMAAGLLLQLQPDIAWLGVVVLAAAGWEFVQGFFNWMDFAAGVIGAVLALGLRLV